MAEVEYLEDNIMRIFQREITEQLGMEAWEAIIKDIGIPEPETERQSGCVNMRIFMQRFEELAGSKETAKAILNRVRHGLRHEQFADAKDRFRQCGNNLDEFIRREYDEQVKLFEKLNADGENFYGQPITDEVLGFVLEQKGMLAPVRKGNELHILAFPAEMDRYINESDPNMKRFYACHCPYARESILAPEGAVSKTLCYCSLGHAKVMWEAVLEAELDGEVLSSVLGGDDRCRYVIYLTDEVMERYVK